MNVYDLVKNKVINVVKDLALENDWGNIDYSTLVIEIPNDPSYGEISTNAAMIIARKSNKAPREIAGIVINFLKKDKLFDSIKVAGNGFINFFITQSVWTEELQKILDETDEYGRSNIGRGKSVNIEYGSPNPTGPMHIGHARGSIYGDALASLLEYVGYSVTREFYSNDAGNQINNLVESIYIRYLELCGEYSGDLPEYCYPGQYIIDAAKELKKQYAYQLVELGKKEMNEIIRNFSIETMMNDIKRSLSSIGIKHDVFFYESLLHKEGKISAVVKVLQDLGHVYQGVLEMPKKQMTSEWEAREQILFKSTSYGDDLDRPLQKSDGSWTYFASELAYLQNKINRKFDNLIIVLGADHIGYQKRVEAACAALNKGKNILDVKLCQLVVFLKDGQPLKMSKRAGQFLTVDQVVKIVGKDALRFMILSRKNDVVMEFDFTKVKEQTKDNPVFYVQYANARGYSVINNAKEQFPEINKLMDHSDLSLLVSSQEKELIRFLSYWPLQVKIAASSAEPHRISLYLQNIAAKFHAFWAIGKTNKNLRFIIENDLNITAARLNLIQATINVISNGLELLGVTPVKNM